MTRRMDRLLACCSLVTALGVSGSAFAVASATKQDQTRATNGHEAKECAFPSVVVVKSIPTGSSTEYLCSGTLIHPQVVLYAGHCGVASTVIFGEHWQGLELKSFSKTMPHPAGNTGFAPPNTSMDWAFAVLEEPITGTPVIPVAAGAELDTLIQEDAPILHVGYSANNAKAPTKIVDHHLKWAKNRIARLKDATIATGAGSGGVTACPGDSGGPMLAKTKEGGWRVVGISSSKTGACGASMTSNAYARVRPELLAWVEKESGIDINPCFDPAGTPTPSLACDKFMAYAGDPSAPQGTWDEAACKAAKVLPAKAATGISDSGEHEDASPKEISTNEASSKEGSAYDASDEDPESQNVNALLSVSVGPKRPKNSEEEPSNGSSEPTSTPEGDLGCCARGERFPAEQAGAMACRAHQSSPVGLYLSFAILCGLTFGRQKKCALHL